MAGGTFLCFEGAEKIWERLGGGHHEPGHAAEVRVGRGRREDDGGRRDPHRLDPLGRDHGHLAQRGRRRGLPVPRGDPRGRRVRHHGARLRRGRAHREDGRRRPGAWPSAPRARRRGRARPGARRCRAARGDLGRRHRRRCSGSVATSCWSASTTSAGTRPTTWCTTSRRRRARRRSRRSAACSAGWSTPRVRRSSGCRRRRRRGVMHVLPFASRRPQPLTRGRTPGGEGLRGFLERRGAVLG